jgi:adsorption protein B
MNTTYQVLLFLNLIGLLSIAFFGIDDLILDLVAFFKKLGPEELTPELEVKVRAEPEKWIGIMVANWHEADIIERMLLGNLGRIDYRNYVIFVGTYPNDPDTIAAAQKVADKYARINVVVNTKDGPTSKGQMINEMVTAIFEYESSHNMKFDFLMIHDSEDVIHPLSLLLINYFGNSADFLQVPVHSFNLPLKEIVGATYLDEFAEPHTKDLLVRVAMGASLPSAGVGTAMSRNLILQYMKTQDGALLIEESLTEDYVLGVKSKFFGFKSKFLCFYKKRINGSKNIIATFEYFPKLIKNSIRQKTRWNVGIIFQSPKFVPFKGDLVDKYFLYRDRKGPWANSIALYALILLIINLSLYFTQPELLGFYQLPLLKALGYFNLFLMLQRFFQKARAVLFIGGYKQLIFLPIRWLTTLFINTWVGWAAWNQYRVSVSKGQKLAWAKTTHEIPEDFAAQDHLAGT